MSDRDRHAPIPAELEDQSADAPVIMTGAGRWQDAIIEREIPVGAPVLDLGCGGGELLERIIRGQGVELDPEGVVACGERGVPGFNIDLDQGLAGFADQSFDYVIMEETIQTLRRPLDVLREMLRVGRHGVVSFPNFAYWRVRLDLAVRGRMPVTGGLPHRWYNTPNIHLFTLEDFLDWSREEGVVVRRAFSLVDGEPRPLGPDDNLQAEEVLLFIEKA